MDEFTFEDLANRVAVINELIADRSLDALHQQVRDRDENSGAKDLERELAKVHRSLAKAEQILRALAD